ncbi:hypothetical protein [Halomonas sp. 25-S5]|uniref:hypothetical protein n=1 Tax=Halomonas sp. 25-S5 TaxID=2994065 RepID=UPI0024682DFC|nr:hypothetical protein [Halomonas sp. 25-S5]
MFAIDTDALVADLLAIPSPSLHGQPMVDWLVPRLEAAGLTVATTARGDLYAQRPGDTPSRAG